MQKTWLKLSAIQQFTINKFIKKQWQFYDRMNNKFAHSDTYIQGYSPKYIFECKEGMISLSQSQAGSMLIACFDGTSNPVGKTFSVKTNGKTGIEIRYAIYLIDKPVQQKPVVNDEPPMEE